MQQLWPSAEKQHQYIVFPFCNFEEAAASVASQLGNFPTFDTGRPVGQSSTVKSVKYLERGAGQLVGTGGDIQGANVGTGVSVELADVAMGAGRGGAVGEHV